MNRELVASIAHGVEKEIGKFFTWQPILIASGGDSFDTRRVWRCRTTGMMHDDEAMEFHVAKRTTDENFTRNYRIVKLARERGFI